jgi:hypothetical protein
MVDEYLILLIVFILLSYISGVFTGTRYRT